MLVTLSGMVIEVSPLQSEKALSPILVTLSGMVIEVSPLQSEKALSPILVTLSGMVIEVSSLQYWKAESAIPRVPCLIDAVLMLVSASITQPST